VKQLAKINPPIRNDEYFIVQMVKICKLLCNNRLLKKCLLNFNKLALLFGLIDVKLVVDSVLAGQDSVFLCKLYFL